MWKKLSICLLGVLMLGMLLVGCGEKEPPQEVKEEKLKVGMALPGPKNDNGFNQSAYEGLLLLEKEMDAEILVNENTVAGDTEKILRNYAKDGCNIVFGNGFEFNDAATVVAEEFPDVAFVVISSTVENGTNLGSVQNLTVQSGFLKGAFAALMSESNQVAAIGGKEIPPIKNDIKGFEAGAKYVVPNIEVKTAVSGTFDDASKIKEQSISMYEQGADAIMVSADASGRGTYEAAAEKDKWAIATNMDDYDAYTNLIACAEVYTAKGILQVAEDVQNGNFKGENYQKGIADDVIVLTTNPNLKDKIPKEVLDKLDTIVKDVKDGKLDIPGMVEME